MSNFIDLETVGCDNHHNRRIAKLSGSLQLRDYPADIVRLSCAKCGRKGQFRQQNSIERYRADIRQLDLPEEIAQCIRRWSGPGACFKVCDPLLFLLDQLLSDRASWIASKSAREDRAVFGIKRSRCLDVEDEPSQRKVVQ